MKVSERDGPKFGKKIFVSSVHGYYVTSILLRVLVPIVVNVAHRTVPYDNK